MIRKALPVAVVLALLPRAAWADEAHEASAGVNVPLVAIGAALLAAGAGVLIARRARPWAGALVLVGLAVGAVGFLLPRFAGGEAPDAHVSIVEPADGAMVKAGKPVTVRVALDGGTIARSPTDEEGGHLHLYVDGKLQQMPYSTTIEVELEPGRHTLKVEYVDHQHLSFDPEIAMAVEVTAR